MADISSEITAIQEAVRGDETRSALVNALNKMNGETLPSVSVSDAGKMLVVDANGDWSVASSGVVPTPTGTKTITSNGTHDVLSYASADVDVPNTYAAGDEGKVVDNGALVAQTSRSVSTNGTYDTTTNNEVVVNVSGGGGGGGTLIAKSVSKNGVYDATDDFADGYSKVTVNVAGRRLPSAYTEVEYLAVESSGPYINTGVLNGSQSYFELDAKYNSSPSNNSGLFGCMYGAEFVVNTYNSVFYANCGAGRAVVPSDANQFRHKFVANANGIYIDEYLKYSVNWNNHCDKPYYLFAFYYDDNTTYKASYAQIYSCKIYNGSDLVRNFVPCYRNSDDEPGMYDLVNDVFYDNDGTGSFSVGPDAVLPANAILKSKSVTQNGTYDPADDNADGYSEVVVDVSGSGEVQYYDPTVNSNYVSTYQGKIVVSGCWATFCCYFALSSTPGSYQTLFTIPEAIRPYGFYSFDVGNGANVNHSYGYVTDNGEMKIYANIAYGYFIARWFVAKTKQQITYDSTYVSSILYGGIAINGDVGHMSCVIDASLISSNGWYYGILTIPNAYKPEYIIRPFARSFTSNPAGNAYGMNIVEDRRILSYIKDTIYTVSDGNIDVYINASRGKYIWLQSEWIIPSAA